MLTGDIRCQYHDPDKNNGETSRAAHFSRATAHSYAMMHGPSNGGTRAAPMIVTITNVYGDTLQRCFPSVNVVHADRSNRHARSGVPTCSAGTRRTCGTSPQSDAAMGAPCGSAGDSRAPAEPVRVCTVDLVAGQPMPPTSRPARGGGASPRRAPAQSRTRPRPARATRHPRSRNSAGTRPVDQCARNPA